MEGTGKLRGKMTDYTSDKISQEMPRTKQFFKRTIFKKKKKISPNLSHEAEQGDKREVCVPCLSPH